MLKRALDISLALGVFVFLGPMLLVVFCISQLCLGSPVLFRQLRPGLHGKAFKMVKFRTMSNEMDAAGDLLADKNRVTRFGNFLRKTSLDEFPAFWNVLKGDMSVVGPRPLLMEYLPLYSDQQATRHDVRPGITGWAQVHGRNSLSWPEKFALDLWYVENRTLWLDLRIIFMTLIPVLGQSGISEKGHATAEKFRGEQ